MSSYSKSRIKNYENTRNHLKKADFWLVYINKKVSDIKNSLLKNPESEDLVSKSRNLITEIFTQNQEIVEKLEICNTKAEKLKKNSGFPNLENIKFSLNSYTNDMIDLQEKQSENNTQHIFTLKNRTDYDLTDLNLYSSDNQDSISKFDIKANETVSLIEDYLFDPIKYHGFITFQVFFCSFPISKPVEATCLTINNVYTTDNLAWILEIKSHNTACKDLNVYCNDVVVLKSFNTRNFQNLSITVNLPAYKGQIKFYITMANKRISNVWKTETN